MKPVRILFAAVLNVSILASSGIGAINRPFPQSINWPGCIKPAITQASMNTSIQTMYDTYKSNYLTKADIAGQFYVYANGNPPDGDMATVSEQHGYAMMIFALMAGYDDSAKIYFDGLDALRRRFPSSINTACMSWEILRPNGTGTMSGDADCATDGDFDMAYALLLANDQWGGTPTGGTKTYLEEAKTLINAFKVTGKGIVDPTTYRTKLGDWTTNGEYTRSSDWMVDHFRAFKTATGDAFWDNVEAKVYTNIADLTGTGKPGATTGLVSDFGKSTPLAPDANGGGTGESNAAYFSWNGCRYPWRMAMGYQHYASTQAKAAVDKLMAWATGTPTGGDPTKFNAGYKLDGTKIGTDAGEFAFVGPITAAAVVNPSYQTFLNKGWTYLANVNNTYDSYGDAIGLLCMLTIAGDWWTPGSSMPVTPKYTITASAGAGGTISPTGSVSVDSNATQAFTVTANTGYDIDSLKVDGVNQATKTSYTFNSVKAAHTIRAAFKIKTFTITATAGTDGLNGTGGTITPTSASVNYGATTAFSVIASTGYKVDSVKCGTTKLTLSGGTYTTPAITAATTVKAWVSVIKYTVTATIGTDGLNGTGGTITPTSASVNYGATTAFSVIASTGYKVDSVKCGTTKLTLSGGTYTTPAITAATTIKAWVSVIKYTVTATAGTGGTLTPSGTSTVNYGASLAYTATPNVGYTIDSLLVDGVNQAIKTGYTFSSIVANHTIRAVFKTITYTITATATGTGSISPAGTSTVDYNGTLIYTATPSTGCKADSLKIDGVKQINLTGYTFSNVTAAHTIAVWFHKPDTTVLQSTTHRIGHDTIIAIVKVQSGLDTIRTTTDTCFTRDTATTKTDSLMDLVIFKTRYDTVVSVTKTINAQIDTLFHDPVYTTAMTENHLYGYDTATTIIDDPLGLDTIRTAIDSIFTTDTTVTKTDSLKDGTLYESKNDTAVMSTSREWQRRTDTLFHTPVVSTQTDSSVLATTETLQSVQLETLISGDTLRTTTDTLRTTTLLIMTTDSLLDGIIYATAHDTSQSTTDSIVTSVDTIYLSTAIINGGDADNAPSKEGLFVAMNNNSSGTIELILVAPGAVSARLCIMSPLGTVLDNQESPAALSTKAHRFLWDGRDASGMRISTGLCFAVARVVLENGTQKTYKCMVPVKN